MKIIKDKRILYSFLVLLLLIFGGLVYFALNRDAEKRESILKRVMEERKIIKDITVDGNKLTVEVANSRHKRSRGLRTRDSLPENEGMLFLFGFESIYNFWTKSMKFPIDVIWVNQKLEVVHIQKNLQPCPEEPCEAYGSPVPARYVIETNGGWSDKHSINVGDKVVIDEETREEAEEIIEN